FIHLWYIAILLQFELVYPIVFLLLQKTRKIANRLPSIITGLLTLGFTIWFLVCSNQAPITVVYYNTFTRIFSLLMGVTTCFIHHSLEIKDSSNNKVPSIIFYGSLALLIALFFYIDSANKLFAVVMVITSIISCITIECAVAVDTTKNTFINKFLRGISDISYEVYLVQYPVIYLYQILATNQEDIYLRALIVSLITFVVSILIHFALSKRNSIKKLQIALCALFVVVSLFGGYQYVIAEDHTAEMKLLEEELAASAAEMETQKAEYEEKLKQENDAWETLLAQLEPDEETIKQTVLQLPVVFIGDSVMLGAAPDLRGTFDNGYVDAKVSRTGWVMADIVKSLRIKGPVVIHAGTNGDVPEYVKDKIMSYCGDHDVFWLTVTNDRDVHVNDKLRKFVEKYENAYLIDWQQHSKGHNNWFYGDKIHLQSSGRKAYTELIYNSIYQVKLDELNRKREEAIQEHENQLKKKISFYGNDLLIGLYEQLSGEYREASFVAEKYVDAETLLVQLKQAKQEETLNYNVVLVLDSSFEMDNETLKKIKEFCEDKEIYIVTTVHRNDLSDVHMISFQSVLDEHPEYYSPDRVHLTQQGNVELFHIIVNSLNKERSIK
ncbi:MAG: acyltransferase family protein, partial [Erysipelotrichaceae bacterium]|nr:acyltransferase family protein [Erysipelotrichaceae bacterium]